ncbi:MAG: hypothetical protein WBE79_08915 [Candidatus Cybelea sp.]|jgi:hypothetical protein
MKNVTKPKLNQTLALFLKVTVAVALLIVLVDILIKVVGFLIPIVLIAAVIAALGLGGFFLYNAIRRRSNLPIIR